MGTAETAELAKVARSLARRVYRDVEQLRRVTARLEDAIGTDDTPCEEDTHDERDDA